MSAFNQLPYRFVFKILQNSVLLGVSVFLYFSNSLWFSVEHYLLSRTTGPED